jgi:single-stranded DNA-specific DHH superfamily exonuclease
VRAGLARHGGHHIDFLVPNRFEFGYGLTPEIVELAVARGAEFLITVDNGISSIAGVAAARRPACRYWLPITICQARSCLTPTR